MSTSVDITKVIVKVAIEIHPLPGLQIGKQSTTEGKIMINHK